MRKIYLNSFLIIVCMVFFLNGCSKDEYLITPVDYNFASILNDYTDKVIITTYLDLKNKTEALKTACENYNTDPTQANLDITANAWVAAREPWEASEGFLFGPVSFLGLDPSLDTWPLDETQLTNVLNSGTQLTPEYVKNGLDVALRGFHSVEYFLFLNGQPRTTQLKEREREYLVSASTVLSQDANAVYQAWINGFGNEFKNSGNTSVSRYASQTDAVLEIVEGIIGIADEVGNGKIAGPYGSKNPLEVESQFSWNSITDFTNNIKSIKNAYTSDYQSGTDGVGLDEFVKSKNQNLHNRILEEIDAAILAIGNIPEPFRNNLNADAQIQAAINACNIINTTFNSDVKPLFNQ